MAQTKYTYSIATDTLNAKFASDSLEKSIRSSAILTALDYVSALGDDIDVFFKDALSTGDKTILDGLISAHDGVLLNKEYIQKTQMYLGAVSIKLLEFGFNFVATKTTVTDNDLLLPVKYMRGAGVETENHEFGDWVTVQMVDVDNVLGAGAGYVADQFGKEVQIPKSGLFTVLSESLSSAIPAGLYIRIKYNSVGTVNDVKVRCNCRGYNDVL